MEANIKAEQILDIIKESSNKYGLSYFEIKPGTILISSSKENWILKTKGMRVRKIFHQNHGRACRSVNLPCKPADITGDIIRTYFHSQNMTDDLRDVDAALFYIRNHGYSRDLLDRRRQQYLQRVFA